MASVIDQPRVETSKKTSEARISTATEHHDVLLGLCLGQGSYGRVVQMTLVTMSSIIQFGTAILAVKIHKETDECVQREEDILLWLSQCGFYGMPHLLLWSASMTLDSTTRRVSVMTKVWGKTCHELITTVHRNNPIRNYKRLLHCGLLALDEMHSRCGVIHRDLKPDNIMIEQYDSDEQRVVFLDFGFAGVKNQQWPTMKLDRRHIGAPLYLSPEMSELRKRRVNLSSLTTESYEEVIEKSDVWAFLVSFFQLYTRQTFLPCGIPEDKESMFTSLTQPFVNEYIVKTLKTPTHTTLVSFFTQTLIIDYQRRPSARECIDIYIKLFSS
jgi:serine/threonine protein kinase